MSDIKLRYDTNLMAGDLLFSNNDLEKDEGLATSVIISLFSDRRAADGDILPDPNSTDKRGFWGDQVLPYVDGDQLGSRLWLLERSKDEEKILALAETYIEESLQWMLDDGIALDITTEIQGIHREGLSKDLRFKVIIQKSDGQKENYEFDYEWGNI